MGQHGSARLSVHSRLTVALRVQEQGWTVTAAAQAANVSRQTASKWVARYRELGDVGLGDRSIRPHRIPTQLSGSLVRRIARLRRHGLGLTGSPGCRARSLHGLPGASTARARTLAAPRAPTRSEPLRVANPRRPGAPGHQEDRSDGQQRRLALRPEPEGAHDPARLDDGPRGRRRPLSPGLRRGAAR